jgi:hypothetical protein
MRSTDFVHHVVLWLGAWLILIVICLVAIFRFDRWLSRSDRRK